MPRNEIDLKEFAAALQPLVTSLSENNEVYADPHEAFADWEEWTTRAHWIDYYEPSVTIYIDQISTWRFDVPSGEWSQFESSPSCRYFRILPNGVMGELTPDTKTPSMEWFEVSSPEEAFSFIEVLNEISRKSFSSSGERETPAEELIGGLFVPFYRFPDDLSLEDPIEHWTNATLLGPLIKEHLNKHIGWMEAPVAKLRRQALESGLEERYGKTTMKFYGQEISHADFIRTFVGQSLDELGEIARECAEYAARATPSDLLPPERMHETLPTGVHYGWTTAKYFDHHLPMRISLTESCFAPFFRKEVNPAANEAVTAAALKPYVSTEPPKASQPMMIPPLRAQKRLAFESLCYRHHLKRASERLTEFGNSDEALPDHRTHARRMSARYHTVVRISKSLPSDELEIARVTLPLPFFCEVPLLHWERAEPANSYHAASACFGQILKVTTLFALEELHAVRSSIVALPPFPHGMLEGLMGSPSLGHWAQTIDHLAKLRKHLTVWRAWLSSVDAERESISNLIELRNRISHPDFVMNPALIKEAEKEFANFFNRIIPKLRSASMNVDLLLPLSRRSVPDDDGKQQFLFRCLNLKTASEPFPEIELTRPQNEAYSIVEDQLIAISGVHAVPLSSFFPCRMMDDESREFFVYDQRYTGSEARMTGVLSGIRSKVPVAEGLFSFG